MSPECHIWYLLISHDREEDDPSECAVPISTALIKQIATKSNTGGTANEILSDFYGYSSSPQSLWPYSKKDSLRYSALLNCSERSTFAKDL